jgi:hypothetical protein
LAIWHQPNRVTAEKRFSVSTWFAVSSSSDVTAWSLRERQLYVGEQMFRSLPVLNKANPHGSFLLTMPGLVGSEII